MIPLINISPLFSSSDDEIERVSKELLNAAESIGFFYIEGTGIAGEEIEELFSLSRQFFDLPREEKMKIHMSLSGDAFRGYSDIGEEQTSGKPDWHECIDFFTNEEEKKKPMHGKNLFPSTPEELAPALRSYAERMKLIGFKVMMALGQQLKFPEKTLKEAYSNSFSSYRVIHYPPFKKQPDSPKFGIGEHSDYGNLTMLVADSPGLEVQLKNGEWTPAKPRRGAFVCNLGDQLSAWSNGRVKATRHRVLSQPTMDRISIPFFFEPSFDFPMTSLYIDEESNACTQHNPEETYGLYLFERYKYSYKSISD